MLLARAYEAIAPKRERGEPDVNEIHRIER